MRENRSNQKKADPKVGFFLLNCIMASWLARLERKQQERTQQEQMRQVPKQPVPKQQERMRLEQQRQPSGLLQQVQVLERVLEQEPVPKQQERMQEQQPRLFYRMQPEQQPTRRRSTVFFSWIFLQ